MTHAFMIILVTATCTFLTRALPFLFFGRKKKVPDWVQYLGKVFPPAIMAVLVVYCFKDVNFLTESYGVPEILASMVVILLHIYKKNVLFSIGCGTLCYMILIQIVFR